MSRNHLLIGVFLVAFFVATWVANAGEDDGLPEKTAFVTGASHIDLEWKWRFDEAIDVCFRTYSAVLDIMDDHDDDPGGNPVFYSQSQALSYKKMEELHPDVFARIAQRVQDGQWEIVGGMWVEPDANLPGGESFVRQIFYGKRYFYDRFGVNVDIGWLPDSFGYNGNLPQFFARAGIEKFYYFKTNWNDTHTPTIHTFWWEAPDGSRVLAHLSWPHYNNQILPWTLRKTLNEAQEGDPNQPGVLYPIGLGDHGGGIGRWNINRALNLAGEGWPIHFGPAADFFDALNLDEIDDVIADELYLESHRGAYTSRALHKEEVRAIEYGLCGTEAIRSLAGLQNLAYPNADLEEIWSNLMLDQFHDTMAGTCLEVVYAEDVAARHEHAFTTLEKLNTEGFRRLSGATDATPVFAGEGWFVVFNPLGFSLTAPVLLPVSPEEAETLTVYDGNGGALACQLDGDGGGLWMLARDLPAFGWRSYRLASGEPGGDVPYAASATHLENAHLSLDLSEDTGLLLSLVSLDQAGREFIQPGSGGNLLQVYKDKPKHFDAWDIGFDKYTDEPLEQLTSAVEISLVESGPVRSVIRILRQGEVEDYQQDLILYYDLPRVDFTTKVFGWGETAHRFLKVAFPLNLVNEKKIVTTEMPYGVITRPLDGQVANFEFAGHKWADISANYAKEDNGPGIALLSREKFGYDVANDGPGEGLSDGQCNILRLSLLKSAKSPRYLLPDSGGPITDRGDFSMHYALYPHEGNAYAANLLKVGHAYYAPFLLYDTNQNEPSALPALFDITPENVLALWLKQPEMDPQPNQVLLRIVESQGEASVVRIHSREFAISTAALTNLLEEPTGQAVTYVDDQTVELVIGAHEIATVILNIDPLTGDDDNAGDDDDDAADDDAVADDDDDDDEDGCGC